MFESAMNVASHQRASRSSQQVCENGIGISLVAGDGDRLQLYFRCHSHKISRLESVQCAIFYSNM